ncbi:MAG: OsmC family protein [Acidobacteriota bacterium]|jgi:putative redox protein|nr:OsmC family protein [Acidobacteriota bacterium]
MELTTRWLDGMAFETDLDGHKIIVDANPEVGGRDQGPSPKPLVLVALAGCTAMDVISILKKMRQEVESFSVRTRGETADEHPKRFTAIEVTYVFEGAGLCSDKVIKAVSLSEERYCGVFATLRPGVDIRRRIILNGNELA